ncbi:MAG: hypothetical protein DRN15_06745 [Thermoprotei archaeon]|nr:MAG: hypothetical protein DRN15_06745 [Thermoprotei archaeon]RLF25563.1 MAG: hypothetical protein DRM97_01400 [Thermoprotei archaeon]
MRGKRPIRGVIVHARPLGETMVDDEGNRWELWEFIVELRSYSKRGLGMRELPQGLKGRQVKVYRWCLYDWHHKEGSWIVLDPDEIKNII